MTAKIKWVMVSRNCCPYITHCNYYMPGNTTVYTFVMTTQFCTPTSPISKTTSVLLWSCVSTPSHIDASLMPILIYHPSFWLYPTHNAFHTLLVLKHFIVPPPLSVREMGSSTSFCGTSVAPYVKERWKDARTKEMPSLSGSMGSASMEKVTC